jgi:RHS repeat-associated protein
MPIPSLRQAQDGPRPGQGRRGQRGSLGRGRGLGRWRDQVLSLWRGAGGHAHTRRRVLPPHRPREFAERRTPWQFGYAKLHLGSTSLATTASGAVHSRQGYYPYGETRYATGTLPTDFGFTGQRNDATIGLYDYHARWYDPALGRFISADTLVPDPATRRTLTDTPMCETIRWCT